MRTDTIPTADEEQVSYLEHDQRALDKRRAVPRAHLGRRATVALWSLRVFVIVVSAMVIYTFVAQVAH